MLVLDVGSGKEGTAHIIFGAKEPTVIRLDIDPDNTPDFVHDITQPLPAELLGRFDVVLASHVLEHISRYQVIETLTNLTGALKHLGELWVLIPSIEWASAQVMSGNPSPAIHPVIWGGQLNEWDYHKSGYTLATLRQLMENVGLTIKRAEQAPLTISQGEKVYHALQSLVVGMKYVADASLAVD